MKTTIGEYVESGDVIKERLESAIRNNDTTTIDKILSNGFDIQSQKISSYENSLSPLEYAIATLSQRSAIFIMEHGGDAGKLDWPKTSNDMLLAAVLHNNHIFADWFLKNGHYVFRSSPGETTIYRHGCSRREILLAKRLGLEDRSRKSHLHIAVSLGYALVVETLIKHGANVDSVDSFGQTPLFGVIHSNFCNPAVAKILLDNGANVNATSNAGNTLLHYVGEASHNLARVVEEILKYDVDIEAKDMGGETPIFDALFHPEIIRIYLRRGANINFESGTWTPLECACHFIETRAIPEPDESNIRLSVELLVEQIIKLKIAGFHSSRKNLSLVESIKRMPGEWSSETLDDKLENYDRDCEVELNKLERNLGLSVRAFLTNKYPSYVSDLILCKKLDEMTDICYPIYGPLVRDKFERDKSRYNLIVSFKNLSIHCYIQPTLPEVIWERIISYLSDTDLKRFL